MSKIEIVLFTSDDCWKGRSLPTKLIIYEKGNIDLHRQTGKHFERDIERAENILNMMGLAIDRNAGYTVGPSGCYQRVIKELKRE